MRTIYEQRWYWTTRAWECRLMAWQLWVLVLLWDLAGTSAGLPPLNWTSSTLSWSWVTWSWMRHPVRPSFVFTPINLPRTSNPPVCVYPWIAFPYDTMEESNFLQQHRETSLDIRGLDIRGREISRILSMTWMYTIRVGNYSYRNNLEQCGWIFWGH